MAKLPDTGQTAIAIAFLVMNLSKMFKQIFWVFFGQFGAIATFGGWRIKKSSRWVNELEKSLLFSTTSFISEFILLFLLGYFFSKLYLGKKESISLLEITTDIDIIPESLTWYVMTEILGVLAKKVGN